jgi:hypothetical protein
MPLNLNEPAIWFAAPGVEGESFELLEQAVRYALRMPADDRNNRASIVTSSGATYGWNAIEHIFERFK